MEEPVRQPWSRADSLALSVLLVLTAAVRIAWASRTLYTVDSVLFSLGTERYDVAALRPHPPGYPVFVFLGWLARKIVPDANTAFVGISILFSLLAVAALYALVREWGSRRAALAASLLFSFAPAFLFNGVIALSYTAEAAASVGLALLAWRALQRSSVSRLVLLGAAWGIAVGIRQSLLLFLAPLVLLPLLDQGLRWPGLRQVSRRAFWVGAPALLTALAWFLPMIALSGGYSTWKRATDLQSAYVVFADSVWQRGLPALREHIVRLVYFLHWDWLVLALAAVAALVVLTRRRESPWPRGAGILLLVWLLPCTLFYLVVFDGWDLGPIGYVLTLLPGMYAAAVLLGDSGLQAVRGHRPAWRGWGAVGIVLVLVPLAGLAQGSRDLVQKEVVAHDDWAESWQRLVQEYPANHTAILTWYSWAHVEWSFPDHMAWTYFPSYKVPGKTDWALFFSMQHHEQESPFIAKYVAGPGQPEHKIPANITTILVFDFQLAGENGSDRKLDPTLNVTEARLADGWRLLLFHPDAAHPTIESCFTAAARGLA